MSKMETSNEADSPRWFCTICGVHNWVNADCSGCGRAPSESARKIAWRNAARKEMNRILELHDAEIGRKAKELNDAGDALNGMLGPYKWKALNAYSVDALRLRKEPSGMEFIAWGKSFRTMEEAKAYLAILGR